MPDPVINKYAPRQIPVAKPSITQAEIQAVANAVSSGWISQGREVAEFEREFAEAHGQLFGVSCSSGTTALHLALAALGIDNSFQRVIVPTLTMVAVANAVRYCRASPLFTDSQASSGNSISPALAHSFREKINKGEVIRAAITVHTYGVPAEYSVEPDVPYIEDCCECHYGKYSDGSPVGSRGIMACFSFYANKIVSSGEGGMVITSDPLLADRMRSLRAHAFTQGDHFHHQELAFGYRMTEMQAAMARVQHARRDSILGERRRVHLSYMDRLAEVDWLEFPSKPSGSVDWVFPLLVKPDAPTTRDKLRHWLAGAGIDTRTYFHPLHRQPHLKQFSAGEDCYPVADDLSRRGLYLPLFVDLQEDDVDYICSRVRAVR